MIEKLTQRLQDCVTFDLTRGRQRIRRFTIWQCESSSRQRIAYGQREKNPS
jgi:hypothetical protein